MASVLIVSKQGDAVPLAIRLSDEGHIVKIHIQDKQAHPSLEGYRNPTRIGNLKMLEQYDLILYDMAGLGKTADDMKEKGRTVLGGGVFNDNLELDREYGESVAQKLLKAKVPKGPLVKTKKALIDELEKATEPQVIKPLGNKLPGLTLVSEDINNRTLISIARERGDELIPAILQERIDGIEISTEGWFNGSNFVCFNHTIEHKRFMEGDRGQQTGCMGNVVWSCGEDEIVKRCLLPLQPLLARVEFVGPIDVNIIATKTDLYFLEFTPRFGYDAIQAYSELVKGTLFDFLWNIATEGKEPKHHSDYAIAVRLSMPPYPNHEEVEKLKGFQVMSIQSGARRHLFLSDVMLKDGVETLAGVDGVIGCATARGEEIHELRRRVYRTIDRNVIHPDVQYRKDIGAGVDRKVGDLVMWGWLDA